MNPLRNIVCFDDSEYMRGIKTKNIKRSRLSINENLVWEQLDHSVWTRQVIKGFRVFDFWCHRKGCAIEVDGEEHKRDYDNYRDEYNYRRSGILVLRVRNSNQEDLDEVIRVFDLLGDLKDRKLEIGIAGNTKESRRVLSSLPYNKDCPQFLKYLQKYNHNPYWIGVLDED